VAARRNEQVIKLKEGPSKKADNNYRKSRNTKL
jgi:hypothetical protein